MTTPRLTDPRALHVALHRTMGRAYPQLDIEAMDTDSRRELARLIRDIEDLKRHAEARARRRLYGGML